MWAAKSRDGQLTVFGHKPIKDNNGIWHNSQKDGWEFPVNKSVNSYEKIEEDTEPVDLTDTINAFLNYV